MFLALGHQLLWDLNVDGRGPRLGGNLATTDPALQAVIFRIFASISSLFAGVIVGAISGLIASGLNAATRRNRRTR